MRSSREGALLTVAAIRRGKGKRVTEVLFNERQQIFRLPSGKARSLISNRLRAASRTKSPVKALLDPLQGTVRQIAVPSEAERMEFRATRTILERPAKSIRINVDELDPTRFNIVGRYLKWPIFRLCKRVMPDYGTAKDVFDFCAAQSCALPGPPTVSPCIPFQYVIDGCYARAHQMRKIIENRFGYCCEKVFSFALGDDRLAVRADKWGGCCVTWWYHVAPLVRVRIKILSVSVEVAMVIDPGMFNKPVLLTTWLMAQENASCSPDARVTMYSIQAGSAYCPANGSGTAFTTDPTYTDTNATLIQYSGLTTCS